MRSPFPGMDPFIEAADLWEDFHSELIAEIKRALLRVVPERYVVRTGERSYIVLAPPDHGAEMRGFQPDVSVARGGGPAPETQQPEAAAVAVSQESEPAPVRMQALVEMPYREAFVEIRQAHPKRRLITCIEILSPSNKRFGTKGCRLYNRKRQAFLQGYAHLVEMDLLRQGRRMPMISTWPDSPYYLSVCRKEQAPYCTVWPAYSTRPLPSIPIPLAWPDPDVRLEIQPLVEAILARSRYDQDIDYHAGLHTPLSAAESAWFKERLGGGSKQK